MSKIIISEILKQHRHLCDMTPEQVVAELQERGFSISSKALYAYESGTNLPKVPIFLALCDIYNIRDIMDSFGYKAPLLVGDNDWASDQYEDFFKVSLYEKIYLLAKWGIPSFEGYEALMTAPAHIVLSDKELMLINKYRKLSDHSQGTIDLLLDREYSSQSGETSHTIAKEA